MLTKSEVRILRTFKEYLMKPGVMLCFSGPEYKRDKDTLDGLAEKKMLIKERFTGGYSLTKSGYAAMRDCQTD